MRLRLYTLRKAHLHQRMNDWNLIRISNSEGMPGSDVYHSGISFRRLTPVSYSDISSGRLIQAPIHMSNEKPPNIRMSDRFLIKKVLGLEKVKFASKKENFKRICRGFDQNAPVLIKGFIFANPRSISERKILKELNSVDEIERPIERFY